MEKKSQFLNGEMYHVVLRTVGDTVIFEKEDDFYRGIFSIYEFNNTKPANIWLRRKQRESEKLSQKNNIKSSASVLRHAMSQHFNGSEDKREKIVEVMCFSFMPNHLHLLLKQLKENGVTEFMRKVGIGYAKYFNQKYNRKGHLFNRFRAVHIQNDDQIKNVFTYIHTNLIALIEPGFKENGVKNPKKVKQFLENNKRHSYLDYIGKKNFPSVTDREFLLNLFGGSKGCMKDVDNWITHKNYIAQFRNIFLE